MRRAWAAAPALFSLAARLAAHAVAYRIRRREIAVRKAIDGRLRTIGISRLESQTFIFGSRCDVRPRYDRAGAHTDLPETVS